MRGDEPDGATVQLCLLVSELAAVALGTAVSDARLSGVVALVGVEDASTAAAADVTSPTDAAAEAAVSVFFADKSITSGSHNFFT